ncbi:response regulator [Paenibacillus alkalitolerans]|uniref:response regulator n=1 Tax=Paenibacillus alkalitolerans TaxID=2799335 RepID=UPI0018F728E4|nr:response regulator [Paenibacillus alkalitolerans]
MIEILLVDDETYVTESLARTIPWEQMDIHKVYQASSAADALLILEEQSVDIVVTDIRMPVMDGLKLIETIGQRWPHIRCILLTGHSDFDYAKKAIQLQAFDYILKPVNDDEFIGCVSNAIESLKDEWSESDKYHQLLYSRKSDFTVLRANLLNELLLGRRLSSKTIKDKLNQYEIPLKMEEEAVMMLILHGKHFAAMDHHSVSLMEFAVGNIAEEVFTDDFHVWHSKAPHDCLVLIAQAKDQFIQERVRKEKLQENVRELQKHVGNYLKGDISVIITNWFQFPDELPSAYRSGLSSMFGNMFGDEAVVPVKSIESLYKPPTLIHLLESKQWEAARQKINDVLSDMEQTAYSREHLYEVLLSVTNAFMYIAHKQGHFIHEIDHAGMDFLMDRSIIRSPDSLRNWALSMLDKLKTELSANDEHTRSYIIKQVQEIVSNDLGHETSVKTIADRVYLHPVYLSKIYKAATGESLGDYIIRIRMERALYLLKNTNKKIYEITSELGYQNPQYFSKMFKKHYGLTPNEFRDN